MTATSRSRRWWMLAAAVAVVAGLGSTGAIVAVTGAAASAPVSDEQRDQWRTAYLDAMWAPIAEEYPEAIRPVVEFGRPVDRAERPEVVAACLAQSGIATRVVDGELIYSTSNGQNTIEVTVGFYTCTARHPTLGQLTAELNRQQLVALHSYYTTRLMPCLTLFSVPSRATPSRQVPSRATPSRQEFASDRGNREWNPYSPIERPSAEDERAAVEQRCPAVPPWLDYRTL